MPVPELEQIVFAIYPRRGQLLLIKAVESLSSNHIEITVVCVSAKLIKQGSTRIQPLFSISRSSYGDSLSCPKFDRENVAKTDLLSVVLLDVIKGGHLPLVRGNFT